MTENSSYTFQVGDEAIPERFIERRPAMKPWIEDAGVRSKVAGSVLYSSPVSTVGGTSPLFHAISYAFNNHCPLVITPDAIWLTILIGLTHHIDTDPEGMRSHFVSHEGKIKLEVTVESPPLPNVPEWVWKLGIRGFSSQLKEKLNPERHSLIVCSFSTSSETDVLSSEVAMMGAMKHYFEYKMMLLCGFNKVTVLGTPEDWGNIINRIEELATFGLSWWTDQLLPVIRQIKLACEGSPDIEFWKAGYVAHRIGSGGEHDVSGWVNVFYPYIAGRKPNEMKLNPFLRWEEKNQNRNSGNDPDDFPLGLVKAPVELVDHGVSHSCEFYGGLVGVSMADDFTVRPESGVAIQLV